jgi:ligand-binding SRPBCC domain-containing protein
MRLHRLHRTQELPLRLEDAWRFFSDPRNLGQITPPSLGFRMTSPDLLPEIHAGMIITYRISPLPLVSLDWVTEITQARRPHFFIDEQRFGPYRFWHHQHHFEETENGVLCTDLVHYALPFGPLGRVAHALTVRRQLRQIFAYRREALNTLFNPDITEASNGRAAAQRGNHSVSVV